MHCEMEARSFLKSTNKCRHITIFKGKMFMGSAQFDKNMVCINIICVSFDNIFKK